MTYIIELINKEINNATSNLSFLKKEAEPGFDSLWSKGFNDGSQMYIERHITYLKLLRLKIFNMQSNDDDDDI
jgi:hypothetical protein